MKETIYTAYCEKEDMTFILKDLFKDEEPYSTEVVGFYFGRPDEKATKEYIGSLVAKF